MIFNWLKGNKAPETTAEEGTSPPGNTNQPDGLVENAVALASGKEMTDAFYPGHDPIDYYGDGGFRFGSMSHQGALMFLPSGIRRWDVPSIEAITPQSFEKLIAEKDDIEIVLIGTGKSLSLLQSDTLDSLRGEGLKVEVLDTGAAVRTLNILLSEDRAVAAALLAVE